MEKMSNNIRDIENSCSNIIFGKVEDDLSIFNRNICNNLDLKSITNTQTNTKIAGSGIIVSGTYSVNTTGYQGTSRAGSESTHDVCTNSTGSSSAGGCNIGFGSENSSFISNSVYLQSIVETIRICIEEKDILHFTKLCNEVTCNGKNIFMVDPETKESIDRSFLMLLCGLKNVPLQFVDQLIQTIPGILCVQTRGEKLTALMIAVKNNNHNYIPSLLREVRSVDKDGYTALMMAACINNINAVKSLAFYEFGMRNSHDDDKTALMLAIERRNVESVRELAKFEASYRSAEFYQSPLMLAILTRDIKCFNSLFEYNLKFTDVNGHTALMYIAKTGFNEFIKQISSENNSESSQPPSANFDTFQSSSSSQSNSDNHLKNSQSLHVIDIFHRSDEQKGNNTSADQDTHKMAVYSQPQPQQRIQHYDLTRQNNSNKPNLLCLAEASNTNNYGYTALMIAASLNNFIMVRALIHYEEGLTLADSFKTALMFAALYNSVESVKEFIKANSCEIGSRDYKSRSAIMYAIRNFHIEIAELLAPYEYNIVDYKGRTVLDYFLHYLVSKKLKEMSPDNQTEFFILSHLLKKEDLKFLQCFMGYVFLGFSPVSMEFAWTPVMFAALSGNISALKHVLASKNNTETSLLSEDLHDFSSGLSVTTSESEDSRGNSKTCFNSFSINQKCNLLNICSCAEKKRSNLISSNDDRLHRSNSNKNMYLQAVNSDGETALMLSSFYDICNSVEYLSPYEYGITVPLYLSHRINKVYNRSKFVGMTALMIAAFQGNEDSVSILLPYEGGRNCDNTNEEKAGWTALIFATVNNHLNCVKKLIKLENFIFAGIDEDYTALSLYILHNWPHRINEEVLKILVSYQLFLKNKNGLTPFQVVNEHYKIVCDETNNTPASTSSNYNRSTLEILKKTNMDDEENLNLAKYLDDIEKSFVKSRQITLNTRGTLFY